MHEAEVYSVALSPDGLTALTGGEGNAARFWDVATGKPLGPALVHQGFVDAIAFSPNGRKALTGGEDGVAHFWETPLPVTGDDDRIFRWVQALTGLQWERVHDPTKTSPGPWGPTSPRAPG